MQHYRKAAPGHFLFRLSLFRLYLMGVYLNGSYCQVEVDLFLDFLSLQFNTIHGHRIHVRGGAWVHRMRAVWQGMGKSLSIR
jgi:hypothetical protein